MSFKKDGETKIYVAKQADVKSASEKTAIRYTVDDLVRDSDELKKEKEDKDDVSH